MHLLSKSLVRRRNQPAAVDEMKRLDKAYCYTVRRLCISTLHVSLIIRVLPRAESATGCSYRQLHTGARAFYG